MDLLKELERRRDTIREQMRDKQSELEALSKIITGMQRDGMAENNKRRANRNTHTRDLRFAKVGLTDAIRAVAADWIAPVDIRNAMLRGGYKHTAKSTLLGGVFASCQRLAADGKFEVREMNDRKEYRAKPVTES
jgi:hypothetical protein